MNLINTIILVNLITRGFYFLSTHPYEYKNHHQKIKGNRQ